jgi:hypothetical protein
MSSLKCASTLQPLAHPGQIDRVPRRNQTRHLNRKSLLVSAPTGQMSARLPVYWLSSGLPGKIEISEWSPRRKNSSSEVPVTSCRNRMQREQRMHRSASRTICPPMSCTFFLCTLSSKANRLLCRPYFM